MRKHRYFVSYVWHSDKGMTISSCVANMKCKIKSIKDTNLLEQTLIKQKNREELALLNIVYLGKFKEKENE